MSNVEILEEKYEIHIPFAFQQEENQSSMKIQNVQAKHDQPNWGKSLRNLRKWMGPKWYVYEPSNFSFFSLFSMGDEPKNFIGS